MLPWCSLFLASVQYFTSAPLSPCLSCRAACRYKASECQYCFSRWLYGMCGGPFLGPFKGVSFSYGVWSQVGCNNRDVARYVLLSCDATRHNGCSMSWYCCWPARLYEKLIHIYNVLGPCLYIPFIHCMPARVHPVKILKWGMKIVYQGLPTDYALSLYRRSSLCIVISFAYICSVAVCWWRADHLVAVSTSTVLTTRVLSTLARLLSITSTLCIVVTHRLLWVKRDKTLWLCWTSSCMTFLISCPRCRSHLLIQWLCSALLFFLPQLKCSANVWC